MSENAPSKERGRRKVRQGIVVSDKMDHTVTVLVSRRFQHRLYNKSLVRSNKIKAHDDKGARVGDRVRVVETRPLSKTKRWRVDEIVERAK